MKKRQKAMFAALTATLMAGGTFALTACQAPLNDEPLDVSVKIADYTKTAEDRKETFASDGWENGEPFNVWWKADNVGYDGKMKLAISEMTEQQQKYDEETGEMVDTLAKYYGAEQRSTHYYGYGDFTVRMKPSKVSGTASTFFTCTGPYDKWYEEDGVTVKRENDHDEIDIEFLGKDTTKVQFNYFASGVGGHEYMYDLGFDASLEFHDYGFRWTENDITWFVDNKPVYKVERKDAKDEPWPEDPGRIIMNYWCGTETSAAWMGEFNDDYTSGAEYEWIASTAEQQPDPNTAHIKDTPPEEVTVPTEGWTDIAYDGFDGWGMYTVDKTDGITISHDAAPGAYNCCGMDLASSYSWVKFKIKNNADVAADLRIDVKKNGGAGGVEATHPADEKVGLIAVESAASVKLGANEEIEVALKIKDIYVDQFVVFLNSTNAPYAATGSVTIGELKGIVNTEVEPPKPVEPEVPEGDNCVLSFASTDEYTVDKSGVPAAEITVGYAGVQGGTYKNIQANAAELAAGNNTFSVKIKNNGESAAYLRIDLIGENTITVGDNANMNVCNVSAVATPDVGPYTDPTWGGTMFTLEAGAEVVIIITYSNETEMGAVQRVQLYLDSAKNGDTETHDGNITFGEFKFSNVVAEA